jgi:hypothetical protein
MSRRTATAALLAATVLALALAGCEDAPDRAAGAAATGTGPSAPAGPRSRVHFTAAGDYAASADTRAVLEGIARTAPDLHLALGDLSYGATPTERAWCDLVTAHVGARLPFQLVSGNHESDGQDGDIDAFAACLPNRLPGLVGAYGRQWYVDVPQRSPTVRIVMISPGLTFRDGAWSYAAGSPRSRWTEDAVRSARAAGIPWVVVGMHRPCVSMGRYGCDGVEDVTNLLVAAGADLVLTGHEHLYQRTRQLALSSACPQLRRDSAASSCIADADDDLAQGAGTVVATVGTGGTELRDVDTADGEAGYFRTWSARNSSPSHGFLDVSVDGTTLAARFVATSGSYTDAFTIRRS